MEESVNGENVGKCRWTKMYMEENVNGQMDTKRMGRGTGVTLYDLLLFYHQKIFICASCKTEYKILFEYGTYTLLCITPFHNIHKEETRQLGDQTKWGKNGLILGALMASKVDNPANS